MIFCNVCCRNPNPVGKEGVIWGEYEDHNRQRLVISTRMNSTSMTKMNKQSARRMALWNDYIPLLDEQSACVRGQGRSCYVLTNKFIKGNYVKVINIVKINMLSRIVYRTNVHVSIQR